MPELTQDIRKLERLEFLFKKGDAPRGFYQLVRGKLELLIDGEPIGNLEEIGQVTGTSDQLLEQPRSFSVRATNNAAVREWKGPRGKIYEWLQEHPEQLLSELKTVSLLLDRLNRVNADLLTEFEMLSPPYRSLFEGLSALPEPFYPDREDFNTLSLQNLVDSWSLIDSEPRRDPLILHKAPFPSNCIVNYQAGEILCEEGEQATTIYILLAGELEVIKNEKTIAKINQKGSPFGEIAALLDGRRIARVRAINDVEAAQLDSSTLVPLFSRSPRTGRELAGHLLDRHAYARKLHRALNRVTSAISSLEKNEDFRSRFNLQLGDVHKKISNDERQAKKLSNTVEEIDLWLQGERTDEPHEHDNEADLGDLLNYLKQI